jgi:S1-C subfamily serine protease
LNSVGQVVGINVAVASGANNIAFSIPVNTIKDALNSYNANGKFPAKAYLGVEYQVLNKQTALLNNVPSGAYVVNVRSGSPAEKAGIMEGDIIYKIDGKEVSDLGKIISDKKSGDNLKIEYWREGETKDLQVTLGEFSE